MGLSKPDLIPVRMKMNGAGSDDLGIVGAVVLDIKTKDCRDTVLTTKQFCYVSTRVSKIFLSRQALEDLKIVGANFPEPLVDTDSVHGVEHVETAEDTCQCPRRPLTPPPLPRSLPAGFKGTDDEVPQLKEWLMNHYAATAFNICEHQPLPKMTGSPLRLNMDPNALHSAVHKPALVPIHWREQVKAELDRDVRLGVLERVPENTPTTWLSRMVVTSKANGSPRRTVDMQSQNKASVRQTYPVEAPFKLASRIPHHKKKTVVDSWNGYHSVPIEESDRHVTTFLTQWGRYRYCVSPMGFLASGDGYNERYDSITTDIAKKVRCVDDTATWADSVEEAFLDTCTLLDTCSKNGITLNPTKFQFCQDVISFAGLEVTATNIRPCQKFLDAIQNFPTPSDISGARGWFGLVNQGAYAFSMTKEMAPFRHLLKPKVKFLWTDELDKMFVKSKEVIIEKIKEGVAIFDPSLPTCLATDFSGLGIGFFLQQKTCKCPGRKPTCCPEGWRLCLVGSRFLHDCETRYAPIEGEALAVAYGLHQTRYYVLGCPDLTVATDHKPLLNVLNDRSLADIQNRRLLNLKEKTLSYKFGMVYVPGKEHLGPDAASRNPTGPPDKLVLPGEPPEADINMNRAEVNAIIMENIRVYDDEESLECCLISEAVATISTIPVVKWDDVRLATISDPVSKALMDLIEEGFPEDKRSLDPSLRPYAIVANNLSILDGVIMLGQRIVVPNPLRPAILQSLHAAHQSVPIMKERAMDTVYWPNITVDISRIRMECNACHKMAKSNPSLPPHDPPQPDFPFQMIVSDYFSYCGKEYLVVVDRYSNWPTVFRSENGATGLVTHLRNMFSTFGIPEELTTDGGPQFTAGVTQQFLKNWGVRHRLSSVANPHANCRAELGVKQVKRIIADNCSPSGSLNVDKFQQAILSYRNAIDPMTKSSPSLILFGRPIRDMIPTPIGKYTPHETWRELMDHREKAMAKRHSLGHEQWSEHVRKLPDLKIGDHVYVQNQNGNNPRRWERTGLIVEVLQHDQYRVKVDGSGRVTLRNRKFLRKFTPFISDPKILPSTPRPPTPPLIMEPVGIQVMPNPGTPSTRDHEIPQSPSPNVIPQSSPSGTSKSPSPPEPNTPAPNPRRLSFAATPASSPIQQKSPERLPSTSSTPKKDSRIQKELVNHNNAGLKEGPVIREKLRPRKK